MTTNVETGNSKAASMQDQIESAMKKFCKEGRWESSYLFSSEGFVMAGCGMSSAYSQENVLEFAFSLIDIVKLLENDLPVKEIMVRGKDKRILVFRFFNALDDVLVLAAVTSGKKGYRRAMGRLIALIRS